MKYEMTDVGAIRLSNAIVANAAEEYVRIKKEMIDVGEDRVLVDELKSLKRFFKSAWYRMLTTVDGDWLMKELDKKAVEDWEKDQKKKKEKEKQ